MRRPPAVLTLLLFAVAGCATAGSGGDDDDDDDDDDLVIADGAVPDAPGGGEVDAAVLPVDAGEPPADAAELPPDAAELPPDAAEPIINADGCGEASNITGPASSAGGFTISGDTTGYVDDVNPNDDDFCTGYFPDGPDAIYRLTATAGQTITASVTPTPEWDLSIYITTDCTYIPTCVAGADAAFGASPETAVYDVPSSGTYYVVVDGWSTEAYGPYALEVTLE